jgi:hypothetical protein
MQAENIDEVLDLLQQIVLDAADSGAAHGLFAALYLKMTRGVKQGMDQGRFDDAERMDRFDTLFANRYLTALAQSHAGAPTTRAWRAAFEVSDHDDVITLQHLLLGVNAHINLDLAISAAETSPGEILALENDFEQINGIVGETLNDAQTVLGEFNRGLWWVDVVGGDADEWLGTFSISKMRAHAWDNAQELAGEDRVRWPGRIRSMDRTAGLLGRNLAHPPLPVRPVVKVLCLFERGRRSDIIRALNAL